MKANHEEADTHIVLHCIHTEANTIVVSSRDTDVLLPLLTYFKLINCTYLWMEEGTLKNPKYIPVHDIYRKLASNQVDSMLAFHAITGCDTVSHLAAHSKTTEWKIFQSSSDFLLHQGC